MRSDIKKINDFFENPKYDEDIVDFVLEIYKHFCDEDAEIIEIKYLLIDLGFYEPEKDDISDYEDAYIIDFYRLSTINSKLRVTLLKPILSFLKGDSISEFALDLLTVDFKVLIVYDDWKKAKRRNKLDNLKTVQ